MKKFPIINNPIRIIPPLLATALTNNNEKNEIKAINTNNIVLYFLNKSNKKDSGSEELLNFGYNVLSVKS